MLHVIGSLEMMVSMRRMAKLTAGTMSYSVYYIHVDTMKMKSLSVMVTDFK